MSFVEDRSVLTRAAPPPDAVVRYGDLPEQIADVRYGKDGSQRPLVVMIHGGFWRPQYDRAHTAPMCAAIAAAGWSSASIEYRRLPGNPDATLCDVLSAVEKLPATIDRHSGRCIVTGHSAGGHLALWVATRVSSLRGTLALAPVADLKMAQALRLDIDAVSAFLGGDAEARPDVDPCRLQSARAPVAIVHGLQDALVPIAESESYCAHHPNARLIKIANGGHFAVIDPLSAAWEHVLSQLQQLST